MSDSCKYKSSRSRSEILGFSPNFRTTSANSRHASTMVSLRLLTVLSATLAAALPAQDSSHGDLAKRSHIAGYCRNVEAAGFYAGLQVEAAFQGASPERREQVSSRPVSMGRYLSGSTGSTCVKLTFCVCACFYLVRPSVGGLPVLYYSS